MTSLIYQLPVDVKCQLTVESSAWQAQLMVAKEDLRTEFSKRLNHACDEAGIRLRGRAVDIQAELRRCGLEASTTGVGKWLNGDSIPELDKLQTLAKWLGVRVSWLGHGELPVRQGDYSLTESTDKTGPDENGSPSKKDYALIPQYTAKAAAGSGYHNDHVELTAGLAFKRDWLRRTGSKPENLCVIYAEGSSMEPTISDGEVLLIDRTERTPRNGKVFALLRPDGSVSIKRLIQSFSGDWLIRSDNPDKTNYPDEPISPEDLQHVEIIGRSVWRGGGM